MAVDYQISSSKRVPAGSIQHSQLIRSNQQVSPTTTIIVNLPIIEQNALTATPVPVNDGSEAGSEIVPDPSTPTPTPIPVQTGSVNLPIVIGALAIIVVIILAWLFVGFLPDKNKD